MFQSLMSLDDDEIDNVMAAVRRWCERQRISIESAAGRKALNFAFNVVSVGAPVVDVLSEMDAKLDELVLVH